MSLVNVTPNLFCFANVNTDVDIALEDDAEYRKDNDGAIARKVHEYQEDQLHSVKIQ